MIKTIEINDTQKIEVNSAAGWLFIYRSQFGNDILPDLLPMVDGLLTAIVKLMPSVDTDKNEITLENFKEVLTEENVSDLMVSFCSLEIVTLINVLWAMAKNADKNLPEPSEWVNQFEVFPFDTIVPVLFELIVQSFMTTKNSQSLQNLLKKNQN